MRPFHDERDVAFFARILDGVRQHVENVLEVLFVVAAERLEMIKHEFQTPLVRFDAGLGEVLCIETIEGVQHITLLELVLEGVECR